MTIVMTLTVSKSQFKPKALEYFRMVEKQQKKLTITDFGVPVVDIVPHKKAEDKDPILSLRNTVIRYDDPFEPVGLEDWEALR